MTPRKDAALTAFGLIAVLCGTIALSVMVACAPANHQTEAQRRENHGIVEIRLSDGTRCALYYQHAISCDWGHTDQ